MTYVTESLQRNIKELRIRNAWSQECSGDDRKRESKTGCLKRRTTVRYFKVPGIKIIHIL
jgi:hypothetical protein